VRASSAVSSAPMALLRLVLLVVLLAACGTSEPAPPPDVAVTDAPARDAAPDGLEEDAAPDVAVTDAAEDSRAIDAPAVRDAAEDVVRDVTPDAQRTDVAAVGDAPDAPPDPLERERPAELRASVLYAATCARDGCEVLTRSEASAASCEVSPSGVVRWSLRACTPPGPPCDELTGAMDAVTVASGSGAVTATRPRVTLGSAYSASGARRNVRVQFAAAPTSMSTGADGIAGRTLDPMLGEVLLLGCPVR